jgi:hypothetical protein
MKSRGFYLWLSTSILQGKGLERTKRGFKRIRGGRTDNKTKTRKGKSFTTPTWIRCAGRQEIVQSFIYTL